MRAPIELPATAPRRHARRVHLGDRLVELTITVMGLSGLVLLGAMFVFLVEHALPVLVGPDTFSAARLWLPQPWRAGHPADYLWQPTATPAFVSLVPLILGTLKVTSVAIAVAGPVGVLAAISCAEFASPRVRAVLKPTVELLAGVPSVVLGTFALLTLATPLQALFHLTSRLNALVAGLAMALAIVPVIFTLAEDALSAVPGEWREASFALGATAWETTLRVVLPAAAPGLLGALVLGFGRALGETMIALMATGNAALVSGHLTDPARTIAATIAAEMGEAVVGSPHEGLLYLLGLMLFVLNLGLNAAASSWVRRLLRRRLGVA
jgi:phosphate transport system permease protein